MSFRVLVPAATDMKGDGSQGWAVLRGSTHPAEVVAFCWDHDCATEIYEALGRQEGGHVFLAPSVLVDDSR